PLGVLAVTHAQVMPARRGSRAKISFYGCTRLLWMVLLCTLVGMPLVHAQDAQTLKARYVALHEQLLSNSFHRPLYLESSETSGSLKGDIYSLVEQPYAVLSPALQGIDRWCDILILHLNVKSCRSSSGDDTLTVYIGRKFD